MLLIPALFDGFAWLTSCYLCIYTSWPALMLHLILFHPREDGRFFLTTESLMPNKLEPTRLLTHGIFAESLQQENLRRYNTISFRTDPKN